MELKKHLTVGNVEAGIANGGGDAGVRPVFKAKIARESSKPKIMRCAGLEQALFGLQILFSRGSESPGRSQ
jgi:hypothetical protein